MKTNNIVISKYKKWGVFTKTIAHLSSIGLLVASFYLNYRFIGGNDLLDFILFLCFILRIIGIYNLIHTKHKLYNCVADDKIRKIEEILEI